MTPSHTGDPENENEAKLPIRDWFLLPLFGILTMIFLAGSMELIARRMFARSRESIYDCVFHKSTGMGGYPNAVCRGGNNHDTPSVEYRLNHCGYRTSMECGPRAPGAYRIVMIGTSPALGDSVPMEKTIAALLPEEISLRVKRKVELYNEGMWWEIPNAIARNFDEVTKAQPDMIFWLLTSSDITSDPGARSVFISPNSTGNNNSADAARTGLLLKTWHRVKDTFLTKPIPEAVGELWQHVQDAYGSPPSVILVRHFLYKSQSLYVNSSLKRTDLEAGFLRTEASPIWQSYLRSFDADVADIQAQASAAGVPLVVFLFPNRVQAAMISMGKWPAGDDPWKLDDELRAIVTKHGGTYIDVLPDFRVIPNPEQYYYPVDGHPDAEGHTVIATMLARELTSGAVPTLNAVSQQPVAPEQSR